jgi:3-hydroxybutyryl-CoA dehydrogenase
MSTAATPPADAALRGRRVAVIGAGLMGHGLAQVFAEAGAEVSIHDPQPAQLASVLDRVRANLETLERDVNAADRITPCERLDDAVPGAELVVEAGPENPAIKQAIFGELDALAAADAVLATNTSSIPIEQIAAGAINRGRVVGTHWWNPPYLIPLVEVVPTPETRPDVTERTIELLRAAGKTAVHVRRDVPGFVGNRLQHALWREAVALVAEGVCDAETVDTVIKNSFGLRLAVLGPLENADLVGLDLTLAIHEQVLPHIDATRGPSPYLQELVAAGRLGMKTGHGFRDWTPEQADAVRQRLTAHLKAAVGPASPSAGVGSKPTGGGPE